MLRPTSRHLALALVVLIVLGVVVPPFVNVGRYKVRIADAMSRALERPVTFDKISLRLLPQPGFDFENLVVGDDPSYSAEPMLRAEEVTAYLRMASLWRGRLEIARLQLNYPSLNLVRRGEGEWNLESLLYRASQTPVAPTTAKTPEARPRFPYIEATNGRINFKYGLEKKVFALTDAKFALWSPGQDEWRMRLQAKPVRTDTVIADSGLLQAEGSFHRAQYLRDTRLDIEASLERSQLGQLTRLIWGRDRGWRGALKLNLRMSGTPADLKFQGDAAVDDFRRYDIMRGEAIRLQTRCTGTFSSVRHSVEDVNCTLPAGRGAVTLTGALSDWRQGSFDFSTKTENVPMDWAMTLARHVKRDIPDDLTAAGVLNSSFELQSESGGPAVLKGNGETEGFALRSSLLDGDLKIGRVSLLAGSSVATAPPHGKAPGRTADSKVELQVLPFPVSLGMPTPAAVFGSFTPENYNLGIQGDVDISRLLQLARAMGVAVPRFQFKGSAKLNASIGGQWKGFEQPQTSGTMQAKNVTAEIPGVNGPVKVSSADIVFGENSVLLRKLVASAGLMNVSGTAQFPRHCESDQSCGSQLDVQFEELDLSKLNVLLNPKLKQRPWYKFFGSNEEKSVLASWQASGTIGVKKLELKGVTATKVSTQFSLNKGQLSLKNLQAELFGGKQTGQWDVDFTGNSPQYAGSGTLTNAAVVQLAALTKDAWGTGQLSGSYEVQMAGLTDVHLMQSLKGKGEFTWRNGQLRHLVLDGKAGPVKFPVWSGICQWTPEGFRVVESKLHAAGSIYKVSGTIQPSKDLRLEFVRGDGTAYQVTGTLEKPQVAAPKAVGTAEASLRK